MANRRLGAKPFSKSMLNYNLLDPQEQIRMAFEPTTYTQQNKYQIHLRTGSLLSETQFVNNTSQEVINEYINIKHLILIHIIHLLHD